MTHTHAKGQWHRSRGSKVRVESDGLTNGQTEAIALPPARTQTGNKITKIA